MPARSKPDSASGTSRRRSGRISSTEQKSVYFEETDDSDRDAAPASKRRRKTVVASRRQSRKKEESDDQDQYQDESADQDPEEEEEDNDDDDDDEQDDEQDSDAPRKVHIIPLEKMRDSGGIDYADHKIHRNSLLFLKDLKANNKRSWLKSHDGEYRRALKDWQSFVETATQTIIQVDETVPELPTKDVIFRIYRDVRFSKIKTPYKPYFSAAWSRTGRKGPYACYYVHCEPGSSFIGGGLWQPEAAFVAKLRRHIDRHPNQWREALSNPLLRKVFFPKLKGSASHEAAIKAFADKNKENALKKRPKAYEITHRDIELLKLRNYTVGTKIDADLFTKDNAQEKLTEMIQALCNFVTFLNGVIMPDPALVGDEGSDTGEDDGDGDGDGDE